MKYVLLPLMLIAGCMMLLVSIWTTKKMNSSLLDELQRSRAEMEISEENSETCGRDLDRKTEDVDRKLREIKNLKKKVAKVTEENSQIKSYFDESNKLLIEANK